MSAENTRTEEENVADKMNYGSWRWWPLIPALEAEPGTFLGVQGQPGL